MQQQNQTLTPTQIKELETILAFHNRNDDASYRKRTQKFDKAADYLDYRNWDLFDEISSSGCETCGCGYGSSYGYILVFWN